MGSLGMYINIMRIPGPSDKIETPSLAQAMEAEERYTLRNSDFQRTLLIFLSKQFGRSGGNECP
jgi:hypothetical protein